MVYRLAVGTFGDVPNIFEWSGKVLIHFVLNYLKECNLPCLSANWYQIRKLLYPPVEIRC